MRDARKSEVSCISLEAKLREKPGGRAARAARLHTAHHYSVLSLLSLQTVPFIKKHI